MYKVLVVDTETGGLDPTKQSILSIGAVVLQDGVIKDEFYRLLREPKVIAEERALNVNGFSLEEIERSGTEVSDALTLFKGFLKQNNFTDRILLAGHNTQFDVGFLKRWFRLVSSEKEFNDLFSYHLLDTVTIAKFLQMAGFLPNLKSLSLDSVCSAFAMKRTSNVHGALEDARLTAQLIGRMIERTKEASSI